MKKIYIAKPKETKLATQHGVLIGVFAFVFGCIVATTLVLHWTVTRTNPTASGTGGENVANNDVVQVSSPISVAHNSAYADITAATGGGMTSSSSQSSASSSYDKVLYGTRILIAIAAFDFAQIPHLEEVLDGYHDTCLTGAQRVDVVIHATVAYPVTLIDLWNTRYYCPNFSLTITLKNKSLRLHLVDCHRELFYANLDKYDIFIYTEDDIEVTPTTIATYLYETYRIERLLSASADKHKPSDFNVGIVRYEYNYPANVIMDDNTRHITQNVTRVYWEHSGFKRPAYPNAIDLIKVDALSEYYIGMKNHHQGMFLATADLLRAWRDRPGCEFDRVRDRPGRGSQPTEGTQRVWMSSQMLYGGRHCKVQQLMPIDKFGTLTVLHLPNKNYRRVGKYRNRKFADGSEVFEQPSDRLLSAMEMHLQLRQGIPPKPQTPYTGIKMVDEVDKRSDRSPLLERRMKEYNAYVARGGVMTDDDMKKTTLVEDA